MKLKNVYICGDSFSTPDPDYKGICWVEIFSQKLNGIATVVNLSSVCASNLLINIQVNHAISKMPDLIICFGTSCTRNQVSMNSNTDENLHEQFQNKKLVCYSMHSFDTTEFNDNQKDILKKYYANFFDLNLAIYENKCIIENTLQNLSDSKIKFIFDKGGFEHKSFGGNPEQYFLKFKDNFSNINLWDYADTREYRPYFHIPDINVNQQIAQYYYDRTISFIG
jgi:hypothetical protein